MVFNLDVRRTVAYGKAELAGSWVRSTWRESEWEERGTDHIDGDSHLLPPSTGVAIQFPGEKLKPCNLY